MNKKLIVQGISSPLIDTILFVQSPVKAIIWSWFG